MQCPYCKNKIADNSSFCPACGQVIAKQPNISQAAQSFWDEYKKKAEAEENTYKDSIEKIKAHSRRVRKIRYLCGLVVFMLIAVVIICIETRISTNKEILAKAHESMIAETYDDTIKHIISLGTSYNRRIVTITSDNSLEFVEGNYESYLDSSGYLSWIENEVYRTETYSYELTISFLGQIYIHIDEERYKVRLSDDGAVSSILLYN